MTDDPKNGRMSGLTFGQVIEHLIISGGNARRKGWENTTRYIYRATVTNLGERDGVTDMIVTATSQPGMASTPWQPSQTDMFATDWETSPGDF